MKRDFLVTTGITEEWEFNENNFLLGEWCKFYDDKKLNEERATKQISIIENHHHWENNEKQIEDYKFLKKKLEYLLEIISEKLSTIHNVNEDKEYWRVIIYNWLNHYVVAIFDRWEVVRLFFEKDKNKKFYSNFITFNELDYIPKNYQSFLENTQKDEWNHLIFVRLFRFLNIQNISLIKKENLQHALKKNTLLATPKIALKNYVVKFIDKIFVKFAFKFNRIIIENFHFPKKEYLKLCLRCKLIPSIYLNLFNFNIKENSLSKKDKRTSFKNLILNVKTQDEFTRFLLFNIYRDIPKSYIEDFEEIKRKILPLAKIKKTIFSMYSLFYNDNFKIYISETKKVGSKYIHTEHGGGLTIKMPPYFNFFEKVSYKIINWDNTEKKIFFVHLSPILSDVRLKNKKTGNACSVILTQPKRYILKFTTGPLFEQSFDFCDELINFVNKLNSEIKSEIKFRIKITRNMNLENKFSKIFGEKSIDKINYKNPFSKTILNSKLIIATYPQTAFSEAMYSNVPTILIIKKNHWQFSKEALQTLNNLKENKIAFENFDEARIHINKHWKEIDRWWESKNTQFARKEYLMNFFNIKNNWLKEWSDYINFLQHSH